MIPPLTNVSSKFGAPMGRESTHDEASYDRPVTILLTRLKWEDGDYDEGGAYWGSGSGNEYIFRGYSSAGEDVIDVYVRAASYEAAQEKIKETYKQATFELQEVAPAELVWNSSDYGCDIYLSLEDARSISGSGSQDDNVAALMQVPYVAVQLDAIEPGKLRQELEGYGSWVGDELLDHHTNLSRWLWLSGCDIAENNVEAES